jgi:two-component system chemotaxis response regulator CheB
MPRQTQSRRRSQTKIQHDGKPSVFTCPDCQGTLFEIHANGIPQFRCRTGHTYSPLSMLEAQDENVERQMWSATRALSEQAEYIARLTRELYKDGDAEQLRAKGRESEHRASIVRRLVTRGMENNKPE